MTARGTRDSDAVIASPRSRPPVRTLLLAVAVALTPSALRGQDAADPRATRPERPTVATHAWTVAPGYLELETGVEGDRNPDGSHAVVTPTLLKIGLGARTQLGLLTSLNRPPGTTLGVGDFTVMLKQRLADHVPLLGAVAVIPGVKLPTGAGARGTGTTDWSLLFVSSNQFGALALDVNASYTRRSGHGTSVPRNATLWTVSAGLPLGGPFGMVLELFGLPATQGPAGAPGTVAVLAGPTLAVRPWLSLDLGAIVHLRGPQPDALYAGLVYNLGRL
jgi:hypothetical protein